MTQFKKYFTPAEAMKTLPLVRKIVSDILNEAFRIREAKKSTSFKDPQDDPAINAMISTVEAYFEELDEIGCFFKDWDFLIGLVDFPSIIDGKEVFLCWRSDEEDILYYHPIEEGFAGRKLIPAYLFN